ncbi:MAG: 16S rRNA (cytosine(1402)-N(4))-methyltransferase RsmH [Burkholderiaceae bacterium]
MNDVVAQPSAHVPVLLNEAVNAWLTDPDGSYLDGTFGRGGHSRALLSRLSARGRLLAFDRDLEAVMVAQGLDDPRFAIRHQAFAQLADVGTASVHGVLLDLGVSSPQVDTPGRGFSFRFDAPLDMRMDTSSGPTVAEWLLTAEVPEIVEVLRDYGEERFAVQIAKALVARRQERRPVSTTADLAGLVAGAVKTREPGQNPATRAFQAFRIHINAELEELQQALEASLHVLRPGGRLVVISFHSLEDRIVKQFIARHARAVVDRRVPFAEAAPLRLEALGRVRPSATEVLGNPRSRSAVMRTAVRTAVPA